MNKIYKSEVLRLFPILEAIKEGKTIQFNGSGVWRDIDGDEEGFYLDTFVGETSRYRIKPEFSDKEEFLKLLNQIRKIADSALFNKGFDPHDWGEVENLVEEMTLKLKGLL